MGPHFILWHTVIFIVYFCHCWGVPCLTDFSVVQLVYTAGPQSIRKADLNCGSSGRFLEMSFITCVVFFFFTIVMYLPTCPSGRLYPLLFLQRVLSEVWNYSAVRLLSSSSSVSCHVLDLSTCSPKCLKKCLRTVLCYDKKKKKIGGTWSLSINARLSWILTLNAIKALRLVAKHTHNFISHVTVFRQSPFFCARRYPRGQLIQTFVYKLHPEMGDREKWLDVGLEA